MRLLQVTSYYEPAWAYGGPPRVMSDFARGLAGRGHEVTVYTSDVLDSSSRVRPLEQDIGGVHVRRFRNLSNALAWNHKKYLPPGLVVEAVRQVRGFDVVHATDARTVPTAAAYLAARIANVPLVVSAHGSLPASTGLRGTVKDAYDAVFVRPMLERASLMLAQTAHEERLYVNAGGRPDRVELLPLPLDLEAVPADLDRSFLRRRLGIAEGTPIILFLGRINYLKGLDVLVEALGPALEAGEAVLCIVGRDDGQWSELAAEHGGLLRAGAVHYLGPLYGAERFHAYASADVFCLTPRHWEETSVASLEAAAAGTAIVVTEQADVPGLESSGGGFVVELAPTAIRQAVSRALPHAVEMGARARGLVERQHDRRAVVGRLEGLLEDLIARAG